MILLQVVGMVALCFLDHTILKPGLRMLMQAEAEVQISRGLKIVHAGMKDTLILDGQIPRLVVIEVKGPTSLTSVSKLKQRRKKT